MFNLLKKKIQKYKEKQYYKNRAKRWEEFKITHKHIQCGLAVGPGWILRRDCDNCCYTKDFFDKYGCMYIKDFENY